jgi:hypothetical protein
MATFVLVPGGWHGSWSFEAVVPLLERAGHAVHALTLTGNDRALPAGVRRRRRRHRLRRPPAR